MLLTLENVSKSFPGVRALSDVNLSVAAAEVHALIGENGAGKSTLIKILSGVLEPDLGARIRFADAQLARDPLAVRDAGIAVIYQQPTLFNELSVCENICMGMESGMINWSARKSLAQDLLQRVGAQIDLDMPVKHLRMAEKQLLEIARALRADARLLIMDEPTAALPQADAEHLLQLVRELRSQGVAIIYISHRLEEVSDIADRISVLRDGALVGTYAGDEIDREAMVTLMAGRTISDLFPTGTSKQAAELLSVQGLNHQTSGLSNISFVIQAGEILGFAGLVGAGRTELAQCLCGITVADSGTIKLEEQIINVTSVTDALDAGIAYVPEDRSEHGVVLDLSVQDNMTLSILQSLKKGLFIDSQQESALTTDYIKRLQVKAAGADVAVRTLSGGNQQKVVLARCLASKPKLLILDEPCQGIDVGAKAEIYALIKELALSGMAIVLISSEMPELLGLADRIAVMAQGRIVDVLESAEATQEIILDKAMIANV